jgi:hypothetical protein
MKVIETTRKGYADWRAQAPWGPCGPLGEAPVFLISTSEVRRRPPIITPRTLARPAARFAYGQRFTALDRSGPRAVATRASTPPPTCLCGAYVNPPGLWFACANCGRLRPPTPAEQATRLRQRLVARGA